MKSRVGLIGYALQRATGGIGRYSRELIAALVQEDQDLTVLQAGRGFPGFPSVRLPGAGLLPVLLTFGQLEIAWQTRRLNLQILHDPTGVMPIALSRVPRVATIHDLIPFINPQVSTKLDFLIYRYWIPLAIRNLDAIITVSKQSKGDINRYLGVPKDKIIAIPEAAHHRFHPLQEQEIEHVLKRMWIKRPYLVYVGSIEPRKNLIRLLEAYAELRKLSKESYLVIVGAHNYWKSIAISDVIEKLNLNAFVQFTGYVPEEDLPALYNGAELFIFPSLYEGFGLPVLEAMSCGVPVITSNTSSLPEIAGGAALLIDPYNIQMISGAMLKVLSDSDLKTELRSRGLERSKQYTWKDTAKRTIDVYQSLLSS